MSTAVGGVPEMVENEVSALLVPSEQPFALADAIHRLLEDENLRRRLAEGGRRIARLHSPEKYFWNITDLFEQVARG